VSLRVHRALSWLYRAETLEDDPDGRFIFLWIAFNAVYATEMGGPERLSEQGVFRRFLQRLIAHDTAGRIDALIWSEFPGSIRVLLDNRFVFHDFWEAQHGRLSEDEWKTRFRKAKTAAGRALAARRTGVVLGIVLSRIYTLRNQLVHGGATWNGNLNRDQVRDCTRFMARFMPIVLDVLMDAPGEDWGTVGFPVVPDA